MSYTFTTNMIPLVIAAAISGALAVYTWINRKAAGATLFSLMMFILFEWGTSYIFELAGTDLQTKVFWEFMKFIGVVATPVAWLLFAFEYTGRKTWVNVRNIVVLSILPLATLIVLLTNDTHRLFRIERTLGFENGFTLLETVNGPWFWVHSGYTYLLIMIGLVMVIRTLLRWPPQYRGQMVWILLATLTPLIANIVTIFSLVPLEIDLTPYAFTVTGVGMGYALFRHRFLDIAPIARDLVIGGMTDGMIVIDANSRIVDINHAAQTMIGLADITRPIGKSLADTLSQWPELIERYQGISEAKDEISIGEADVKRWYELNLSTLKDENQSVIGQIITIRDITERKHAESQILESEARFRQIVENASDLIYRVNTDGILTYANPSALRAMGFESEEEALGKHYLDLTTPEMRHKIKRAYQHQFVSKTKVTYHEFPAITKDGSEVWFGQNVQLIYEDDQIVGFQALARDVTVVKRAQDALRIARDQALEASRAKTQLLSKVSHELRTPLGGILGYAELMQRNTFGQLNQKQNKAVTEIMDSAEYLGNMVNELLDEAQLRSNTASLIEENFSPFKLVQGATSGMDVLAQKKGLTFSMQVDPNLPQEIYGDERRIRQIIINLIGNAIKFTNEGSVRLNVALADENHWEIQVTDTGIGIPKKAQSKIFQPFQQVSSSVTNNNRGVGLGLSITKQLVDLMHGRIVVDSEPDKGSTFTILLPITKVANT